MVCSKKRNIPKLKHLLKCEATLTLEELTALRSSSCLPSLRGIRQTTTKR